MKKNYGVMFTMLLYSLCLYSTQIGIKMVPSIKDIQGEVDLVIIGGNEQRILSGSILQDCRMGAVDSLEGRIIYVPRTLCYENIDHVYKKNQQVGVNVEKYRGKKIITVTEPVLQREAYWCAQESKEIHDYVYQPMKRASDRAFLEDCTFEFRGDDAFRLAKEDLAFCYYKALNFLSTEVKVDSIALLPLGIVSGFPWQVAVEIAISSVNEYVEKRPHDYKKIWLCVVKRPGDDFYPDISHDMVYAQYWIELLKHYHNQEKRCLNTIK